MRKSVYLIRHAEAESNVNLLHIGEAALTEIGIEQADKLAEKVKNLNIDGIFVSPVLRAQLTAAPMENILGIKSATCDFLKERKGSFVDDPQFVPSESFDNFKKRIFEARKVLESSHFGHVVVVSHAIFIKAFISYILLGDSTDEAAINKTGNGLIIDHVTISKIVFNVEKGEWKIAGLNAVSF